MGSFSPSSAPSSSATRQTIYELCVCPNGKLYLSPAGAGSTCQSSSNICLWSWKDSPVPPPHTRIAFLLPSFCFTVLLGFPCSIRTLPTGHRANSSSGSRRTMWPSCLACGHSRWKTERKGNKPVVFVRKPGSSHHLLSKREYNTGAFAISEVKHIVLEFCRNCKWETAHIYIRYIDIDIILIQICPETEGETNWYDQITLLSWKHNFHSSFFGCKTFIPEF